MADDRTLPPHPDYPGEPLGPIWVMPDEDLERAIDRMASTSQARGDAIGYYIAEFDRRNQRKLNERLVEMTQRLTTLTWVMAVLAAVSTAAVIMGLAVE
jgi:hypothetical protein